MSYLGIVASSVLASNALLSYGFGAIPAIGPGSSRAAAGLRDGRSSLASALALACINASAASILWCVRGLILGPLGLAGLDIFFFALIVVPPLKALARAARSGSGIPAAIGAEADELIVGSLVFGIALIAARSGYGLGEAATAGAASGLGYWMATSLLRRIRERLELSDLPDAFKGAPSMLISAGLMSMALLGLDSAFLRDLGGSP